MTALGRAGAQGEAQPDVSRGRHIATVLAGCADCHGTNFAGGRSFTRADGTVVAANITGGAGGVGALRDADLVLAIRAGVKPNNVPLRAMPSRSYAVMTDRDVADVVAFLRSLPPVDMTIVQHTEPAPEASAPIHHHPAPADAGQPFIPLTGGAYLARIGGCGSCHGVNLAGGIAGEGGPAGPNITHDGIGGWTFADFRTAMQTGRTPTGHVLSAQMPWARIGAMTDAELRALYDFLESQPAQPQT